MTVAGDPELDGRRLYRADHRRHRQGHGRGRRRGVRALLHDQGGRQGNRPRPVDGLWHGPPVGRRGADRKPRPAREPRSCSISARPATPPPSEAAADEPSPQAGARAPTSVLVIDDDPDVRGFIVASLEEQGYRVRAGERRPRGPRRVARERPDLVVLDFIMPGLSGAEVASRILAEAPRPADPVRLRLQRDRSGQAHRARRAVARQAVPRRRPRQAVGARWRG